MRRGLVRILLFLLRKASGQALHEAADPALQRSRLQEQTIITIDADGPGVVMKLYCPDKDSDAY